MAFFEKIQNRGLVKLGFYQKKVYASKKSILKYIKVYFPKRSIIKYILQNKVTLATLHSALSWTCTWRS